jgi:hypothetical protein
LRDVPRQRRRPGGLEKAFDLVESHRMRIAELLELE